MENEDKQTSSEDRITSSYNHRRDHRPPSPPARSPEDSPAKSSDASDLSSLSHGLSPTEEEIPGSPPADRPNNVSAKPTSPVAVVNRYVRDEPTAITKVDHGARAGFVGGEAEQGGGGGGGRRRRPSMAILKRTDKETVVKKAALGFRVFEFLFCLISLSVMAADRNQGWALDSFHRYKEFRYSMSVNVIGFVYSGVQGCDLAYQLATGNFVTRHQLRYHLDFAIDQMLTYLLISASSSAATRVDDWQSNWGKDKFPEMATASVVLSFLAFVAFAFSSIISGYALCNFKSL